MKKIFLLFLLCSTAIVLFPDLTHAQLAAPCEGVTCSSCDLVDMGNNLIQWLIGIVTVLFAVLMMVAGFQLVTSGGNPSALQSAKEKFTNAIIGFIIVLSAWLLVDTIMKGLVGNGGQVNGGLFWAEIECWQQNENITIPDSITIDSPIVVPGGSFEVAAPTSCDEEFPGGPRTDCAAAIAACEAVGGTQEVISLDPFESQVNCIEEGITISGTYTRCDTASFESVSLFGRSVQIHRDFAGSLRAIDAEWRSRGGSSWYPVYAAGGYRGCTSGSRSFHDYGFAVDINPDTNPHCKESNQDRRWIEQCQGGRNILVTDMPPEFVAMFTSRGWGWGGNWRTSKDAMHFSMGDDEQGSVPIPGR